MEGEPTDVSDSASVRDAVARAVERHGRLDLVFSNAGYLRAGGIEMMPEETFDRTIALNLRGAFLVAKHTIPHLRADGGGAMVFTCSTSSLVGSRGQAAYCASKAGVANLSCALAAELAPAGIRVNCVCPGWVDTPFNDPVWDYEGARAVVEAAFMDTVPLRRRAAPSEVVPVMLSLASEEASYVTGEAVTVDVGLMGTR